MHTLINQSFDINASVERAWAFLLDAEQVAACMPGAVLESSEPDGTLRGHIAVKLGFVSLRYDVAASFETIDGDSHTATLVATGAQANAPELESVRVQITSHCMASSTTSTTIRVEIELELEGRLAEFGKPMIRSVSKQLTKRFAEAASQRLEV